MKGISLSSRAVSLSLAPAEAAIFFLFVTQHCRLTAAAESPFHYYWAAGGGAREAEREEEPLFGPHCQASARDERWPRKVTDGRACALLLCSV